MDENTYRELKEQYPELHAIYGPSGDPIPCQYCEENDIFRSFSTGGEGGIMICYGCGRMWDRETGHSLGKLDGPRQEWAARAMTVMIEKNNGGCTGARNGLALTPGNAQVVLNWVAPASTGGSAITGYRIYRGLTSGSEAFLVAVGVVLTYTDTGLTNGQIYWYQVSAINVVGEGARSTEASATPVG